MSVTYEQAFSEARRGAPTFAFALLVSLIVTLQFGPIIGLTGFHLTGIEQWALIGVLRDVLVGLLCLVAVLGAARPGHQEAWPPSVRWAMTMIGVCALQALLSSTNLYIMALNLRRLVLIPMLFVALMLIPWTRAQVGRCLGLLVTTGSLVAVFGVVEMLLPDRFWTEVMDIDKYNAANGFDPWAHLGFYDSGRFFSWDLEKWTGGVVRRMVSTYFEPTTLAAGMAALVMLCLARSARGHESPWIVLLGIVCGLATISKGFALFLFLLLAWRVVGIPGPVHALAMAAAASVLAIVAAKLGRLDGPLSHIEGLATGMEYLASGHFLGEGIGAAGGYAETENDIGHESGLGTALGQIGLAAFIPLFWVRAIARETLEAARLRGDPGGPWLAAWLIFWTLTYLLSASSLGVGGNALGFGALALYLNRSGRSDES